MKNLATCKPSEFIAQTAKIRKAVSNWMDAIDFMNIRNEKPKYKVVSSDATDEERLNVIEYNAGLKKKQTMDNINRILDGMLETHPRETLDVLALCCFVEPKDVDNHTMDEYLGCIVEMLQNESVTRFFSLLAQLDQTSI